MDPKIKQLRAFALAVRLGSVTQAAEQMHVTQSAASQLIQQLGEALGIQLFDRSGRKLVPTRAAEAIVARVEEILAAVDSLAPLALAAEGGQPSARVTFCCTPTMAALVMPKVFEHLAALDSGISAVLRDAAADRIVTMVLAGDVEFGLAADVQPETGAVFSPVHSDFLSVVCSKRSPLARMRQVQWEALADQSVIAVEGGKSTLPKVIQGVLAQRGVAYKPAYDFAYMETALAMAASGVGVVLLPPYLVRGFEGDRRLVTRKLVDPAVPRSLYVVTARGTSALSLQAQQFIEVLSETLRHPS